MKIHTSSESELIFAPAADRALSSRMQRRVKDGTAVRIAPGIFTPQTLIPVDTVVRRNWKALVGHVFPGAVLSHKSAFLGGPDEAGSLVVSHGNRAGRRTYPGLAVEVRPGGPLPGDTPYGALLIAGENRWLLECLNLVKGSSSRTLPPERIEAYLDKILTLRGERGLNALRDSARLFSEAHGLDKAFNRLDHLVGALLKTREAGALTSKRALARAAGKPYDPDRLRLFDVLFAGLQQAGLPEIPDVTDAPRARDNQAFFEAYFSNYIEGTTFTVEEAEAVVYDGVVLTNRLEDSHDILGTYHAAVMTPWRDTFPASGEAFLDWLKSVNSLVLAKRSDKKPGEWKDKVNQAGSTVFVHPDLVRGTLLEGLDRMVGLANPAAQAFMAMFVVAEVHPFLDGNGRTARLALNAILTQAGLTRILVPTVFREDYLLPLKALSRQADPDAYIRMLLRLQTWSAKLRYDQPRENLHAELMRCHAFQEDRNIYRLIDPD